MKERRIGIAVLIIIVLLASGKYLMSRYNGLVAQEEAVKAQWSNVEAQYQRRFDLIKSLLSTVKGFAAQEKEVFLGVTEARSKATSIQIDPSNLDPQAVQKFDAAQLGLGSALSRLLLTVEAYPDIKSNQNFMDMQQQLQTTEDMIAQERQAFNMAVKEYNIRVRKFPDALIAGAFGFETKPQFKSSTEATNPPEVKF